MLSDDDDDDDDYHYQGKGFSLQPVDYYFESVKGMRMRLGQLRPKMSFAAGDDNVT